jgi:hypothetical protein
MTDPDVDPDLAFASDHIEDALDRGTVDHRAREHLLSALAKLDADRASERRTRGADRAGEAVRGP